MHKTPTEKGGVESSKQLSNWRCPAVEGGPRGQLIPPGESPPEGSGPQKWGLCTSPVPPSRGGDNQAGHLLSSLRALSPAELGGEEALSKFSSSLKCSRDTSYCKNDFPAPFPLNQPEHSV